MSTVSTLGWPGPAFGFSTAVSFAAVSFAVASFAEVFLLPLYMIMTTTTIITIMTPTMIMKRCSAKNPFLTSS